MNKRNSMLEGNAVKSILVFALPIMASSMLQYNYSLVDNIIVGRYVSENALAAVGSVGPINSFIIGAALGLTTGFSIPVAHAYGEKNKEKLSHFAGSSIVLALLVGCVIMVLSHIISPVLLRLIGTPEEIIDLSSSYVNILYYGVPIQLLSNNFTAISRSVGESKKPLYFFCVSVVVNFVLDLLFVRDFGMGVEGAALATLIAHMSACLLNGLYLFRFNKEVAIKSKDLRLDMKTALHQIKLGLPVSLQFTVTSVGSMCLQSVVNSFGTEVIAGFTAANRVENLTNIPMSGLGVATQTFVGQNYGAGKYDRIIKSVRKIFLLDLLVSVAMSITLYMIGESVVSVFSQDMSPEIMAAAKRYILAIAQCYSLVAILFVMRNTLQGLGFTYANSVAGIGEFFGRLAVAFVLTPMLGFDAVCYAGPAAWLLADIPLIIIYLFKERKFKKLINQKEEQVYERADEKKIALDA
ncbi:MAG: MATE family efflux transporter [Clostridia bacterium]|nr:MATE family efflux transporter [Clostridia bacterium]